MQSTVYVYNKNKNIHSIQLACVLYTHTKIIHFQYKFDLNQTFSNKMLHVIYWIKML